MKVKKMCVEQRTNPRRVLALLFAGLFFLSAVPIASANPEWNYRREIQDVSDVATPLKEINYYPSDYAWEMFWQQWPQAKHQMDTDLDRIQALEANTVRIFLHPSAFGYPHQPTSKYLNYLDEALALIDEHSLKAHVNLFDCWWSWQDLNDSKTWLKAIVETHRNDTRIALWELQNEVDLGYFSIDAEFEDDLNNGIISDKLKDKFKTERFPISKNHIVTKEKNDRWVITDGEKIYIVKKEDGKLNIYDLEKQVVRDWVQVMYPYLKQQAGNTPSTVSVNKVEWLDGIRNLTSPNTPDIYSLHWYPEDLSWTKPFPSVIDRARQLIGQADLLLGEFGGSTYTLSETSQANLYRDVLYYAHQKDIVHLGVWTLNDFPQGTVQCAGYVPPPAEWYFGLYRLDGSPKPAASILQSAFHGSPPPNLSPVIVLNPSFEDLNPNSGQMDNWRSWAQDDQNWSGQQTFTQDCTVAHSGQCSARVYRSDNMTGAVGLYTSPGLPVEPERRYSLQGYVRTENLDGWARIVFAWFDSDAQWLGADTSSQLITDPNLSQWMLVNISEAVPPANAAYFQVYAQMDSDTVASYVWFDDITMLVTPTPNFDTGYGTYPSIMGNHTGTVRPNKTIIVHKMYTYSCVGTGGHTEYVRFYGSGLAVNKTWTGYIGDYHNIFFDLPITLQANTPYNYEIRTGSYPQIIHEQCLLRPNGTINCTQFIDANGKIYYDWIPAIRLE